MDLELLEGLTLREINAKFKRLEQLEGICEEQLNTIEEIASDLNLMEERAHKAENMVKELKSKLFAAEIKVDRAEGKFNGFSY